MSEILEYSGLPNYDHDIQRFLLKGAADCLLQTFKDELIDAQMKLELMLPGGEKSVMIPSIQKAQAVAETLAELGRKFERDLAKKLQEKKDLLEKKKRESIVMAELDKADVISGVLASLQERVELHSLFRERIRSKLEEEFMKIDGSQLVVEQELEKMHVIAHILADLKNRVLHDVQKRHSKHVPKKKSSREKRELTVLPEIQKIQSIAEVLSNLEENIAKHIGKKEKVKPSPKTEHFIKSIILSGVRKMQDIVEILGTVAKKVEEELSDPIINFEVEKHYAVADVLALLGEKVEKEIFLRTDIEEEFVHELALILSSLKVKFDKNIAQRGYALQINLHETLFRVVDVYFNEVSITYPAFEGIISMSKDQPQILNKNAISLALFTFNHSHIAATRQQVLRWLSVCMINNEENRNKLFKIDVVTYFKLLLDDDTTTSPVINDLCSTIQAFVEFEHYSIAPKAPETALKRITYTAHAIMTRLTHLLRKFMEVKKVLINIIATLRKILVKGNLSEILIYVKSGRTILYLYDVFIHHSESEDITHELLQLVYVMVSNDNTKAILMEAGIAYIMKHALDAHQKSARIVSITFKCIAKICLFCPFNTGLFIDFGFPVRIVKRMKQHPKDSIIQRYGSWIFRIFITYNEEIAFQLSNFYAADVLEDALIHHKFKCEFDAKAALRDIMESTDLYQPISKPIKDIQEIVNQ